ncbi:unnamed protein product [Adineta steineri]|uniref:Uncharacterized protein n=1 Tax=Adineta steineri TaxID=433720 RepID=A0A813XJ03_9BILA|nr:unnamed protein product [Adineta steineri]
MNINAENPNIVLFMAALSTEGVTYFKRTNETVYDIWNTTAGTDSVYAVSGTSIGTYYPGQSAQTAFDGDLTDGPCNHGSCDYTNGALACGTKAGFYITINGAPKVLAAFDVISHTGSWSRVRDPMMITIEGSNLNGSALTLGSSWTLIYNGSAGLITDPGRAAWGTLQLISNPSIAFASYRLLVTSKQGYDSCASCSEIMFIMV